MRIRAARLRPLAGLLLAAGALALPAPAAAVSVSSAGQQHALAFGGSAGGERLPGLAARLDIEVVSFRDGELVLDLALANTSDAERFERARAGAVGFQVSAPLRGARVAEGEGIRPVSRSGVLGALGPVDVCLGGDGQCASLDGSLLGIGGRTTTRLTLVFDEDVVRVDLAGFGLRWHDLHSELYGLAGEDGLGVGEPVAEAPLAVLLLALAVGLGVVEQREARRREPRE